VFATFKGAPWHPTLRRLHYYPVGWSVGWHLQSGRNVLLEGHVRDRGDLGPIRRGIKELHRDRLDEQVILLDDDSEAIAMRLAPLGAPA
jgi:hypothetical protein